MIPARRRAKLPPGHWWAITEKNGRRVVLIAEQVPADSDIEQGLVRTATRAWSQRRRGGLGNTAPVAVAATATAGWLLRRFRDSAAGASAATAAAVMTLAVVSGPPVESAPRPGGRPPMGSVVGSSASPSLRSPAAAPTVQGKRGRPAGKTAAAPARPSPSSSPSSLVPVVPSPDATGGVPGRGRGPVKPVRTMVPRPGVSLPVKVRPPVRPCELLGLPVGHCR